MLYSSEPHMGFDTAWGNHPRLKLNDGAFPKRGEVFMAGEIKGGATRPVYLLWVRCKACKKQTWHLTGGKKDDHRFCTDCMKGVLE